MIPVLTQQEATAFQYIYNCIEQGLCKNSIEAEVLLRKKFHFVTTFNSYTFVTNYVRLMKKIENKKEFKDVIFNTVLEDNNQNGLHNDLHY